MNAGLGLVIPITYDVSDGPYRTTKTFSDQIKQNLKCLFFTSPGEKITDLYFGIGIKRFLFETITVSKKEEIRAKIFSQIGKYITSIKIQNLDLNFNEETHILNISLSFYINGLNNINNFNLSVGK
jgi:phage baseplate assembly protein W